MLNMTSSYVMNRMCEDVQQEMIGKSQDPDEIEWTTNTDVLFFYALMDHKPVGVNRHFMMLLIHNKFSKFIKRDISTKPLWERLDTFYDMSALHESEISPFPNEEVDFELPDDCLELLHTKHGVTLERHNSENETSKSTPNSSKPSKKLTPKLKQSSTPVSTPKNNFVSPAVNKPSKSQIMVKNEAKASDTTPKVKQDSVLPAKTGKIKRISGPPTNKTLKSESAAVTKDDSTSDSIAIRKSGSPATVKKPIKTDPAITNHSIKKSSKSESSINGAKQVKAETLDNSIKKIKSDKDPTNKKGKVNSLAEVATKKAKTDINIKKKSDQESTSKKSGEASTKQVKSSSHSSKAQESDTTISTGSRKSSPVVKVKGNENKKMKRPRIEETSKKSMPTSKRRRL